jgi:hypothetical protein
MITIRELDDLINIQGAFRIKEWDCEKEDCITLAEGSDFEIDRWEIDEGIMESKIAYMYAIDGVLNIEVE